MGQTGGPSGPTGPGGSGGVGVGGAGGVGVGGAGAGGLSADFQQKLKWLISWQVGVAPYVMPELKRQNPWLPPLTTDQTMSTSGFSVHEKVYPVLDLPVITMPLKGPQPSAPCAAGPDQLTTFDPEASFVPSHLQ